MRNGEKIRVFVLALSLLLVLLLSSGCSGKEISYPEKDSCGPIPGGFYFKIVDEDVCRQQCFANCLSRSMEFSRSEFVLTGDAPCNKCTCFCKN